MTRSLKNTLAIAIITLATLSFAVDAATGAWNDLSPTGVFVDFETEDSGGQEAGGEK